jgi:hypothetical protein
MYWQVMGVSERVVESSIIITGFVVLCSVFVARSGRSDISLLNQSGGKRSVVRRNMLFYQFSLVIASTRRAESKLKKFHIHDTFVSLIVERVNFHKGGARSSSGFVGISQITTHLNDNALDEANHGVDGGACL